MKIKQVYVEIGQHAFIDTAWIYQCPVHMGMKAIVDRVMELHGNELDGITESYRHVRIRVQIEEHTPYDSLF